MKKLALLAAITLMGMSASCWAAVNATVSLNNFDSNVPVMYMATPTSTAVAGPLTANINVQLLGGPSAAQLQPVVIAGTTTSVIPLSAVDGFFDGGVGVVPGVTAGATATFELTAFTGTTPSSTFASAQWTQATGKWDDTPPASPPSNVPTLQIPASGVTVGAVPEPSTIALGLLGLGALLIRRRK
jgi:hypothetical protein